MCVHHLYFVVNSGSTGYTQTWYKRIDTNINLLFINMCLFMFTGEISSGITNSIIIYIIASNTIEACHEPKEHQTYQSLCED